MSTAYAQADDAPDINEPIVMDSVADQETSDVIDPARKVPFIIKKASVRTQNVDSKDASSDWAVKRLVIDAAIGADGVDGEGKYANKHIFSELILTFNRDIYNSEWWMKKSRGPTKQFLQAMGFDPAQPPTIDSEFLGELVGREFVADILRRAIQEKTSEINANGKNVYRDTGDFKNELSNFRSAE